MKKVFAIAMLPIVLILSACSIQGSTHVDSKATVAHASSTQNPLTKGFGDVITYKDGVSVSVSKPVPYNPSASAGNGIAGQSDVVFTMVVTNHSKQNLEFTGFPQATSGGKSAYDITDIGNNVGNTPDSTLLPGQSITWLEAFSVADPSNITLEYSPSFVYDQAIFTSSK